MGATASFGHDPSASRRERGSVAVELALVLPLLVTLVFGIVEYGRYYNATITLTHAARESVRRVALSSGDPVAAGIAAASGMSVSVSASGACTPGADATSSVSTSFSYNIPFVRSGTTTVTRSARMKCGG